MNDVQAYESMFTRAKIHFVKVPEVRRVMSEVVLNQARYTSVGNAVGMPWFIIAAIHNLESNLRFDCHLYNGDPLSDRTVHVPQGLPKEGDPPFTWEESAVDALAGTRIFHPRVWGIGEILDFLERYNGLGYRERGMNSPYLWSFTDQYVSGLFTSDGVYDQKAVSNQVGAAALIKELLLKGYISLDGGI